MTPGAADKMKPEDAKAVDAKPVDAGAGGQHCGTLYLLPAPLKPQGEKGWTREEIIAELPAGAITLMVSLDRFVVESERSAVRLFSRLRDRESMERLRLSVLDEHSLPNVLDSLLEPLVRGEDVGLVSEAGMPCIADPGAALVAKAHAAGIPVTPLSGPSSLMLALAASGLDGQRFMFMGYLPAGSGERKTALESLARAHSRDGITRLFIETPYRNDSLFADCLAILPQAIALCVASDIAGGDEKIVCMSIDAWKRSGRRGPGKRPAVFLVGSMVRTTKTPARKG